MCVKSRSFHADWNTLRVFWFFWFFFYQPCLWEYTLCTYAFSTRSMQFGMYFTFFGPFFIEHRCSPMPTPTFLNRKITSSKVVPTEENSITGPQTLWHWRTNYRIRPVTFSLHICQSRSSNRSENCHVWLARKQNNSLQHRPSHQF